MTTSAHQSLLSRPEGDDRISERSLAYIRALTRLQLHELVLEAFDEANITQAVLAKRLGKRPEQVSRLLGGPGNWTIDTFADLLFAIDGSLSRVEKYHPNSVKRNYLSPSAYAPSSASAGTAKPAAASTGDYVVEKVR